MTSKRECTRLESNNNKKLHLSCIWCCFHLLISWYADVVLNGSLGTDVFLCKIIAGVESI